MIESFDFFLYDCWTYICEQFQVRGFWEWFLFFFPLVSVLEAPRYLVPSSVLLFRKFFKLSGDDVHQQELFLQSNPRVSIIVAGRNESEIIAGTIDSLLELPYDNKEIIVIDDASDDNMYEICEQYAKKGLIRLYGNESSIGRAGRPVASNIGLKMATGDFIISVDADTSYDIDTIARMIGPFYDPEIGAVAGNLKVRNEGVSVWADLQYIEYMNSISLKKRWTSLTGATTQVSGAFGAFRKKALLDFGGWDPELAEDADLTLKVIKNNWKITFSPKAIAMTAVPENLRTLIGQRLRWDKGAIRTYFHKHRNIFKFWRFGASHFFEIGQDFVLTYVATLIYPFYFSFLLLKDWKFLLFAYSITYMLSVFFNLYTTATAISFSERRSTEWWMLWYIPFYPLYKEFFRMVSFRAAIEETFRIDYKESYIPDSGYKNTARW